MTQRTGFRVALVGCGRISGVHIAALKALDDVDIVAVCDRTEKLANECASKYGIPGVFTEMQSMMKAVRPDVVHLLTPPQTHLALAKIAAEHRAHMYIEKPLASSEAEARAIAEAARTAGVEICPGHCQIFEPNFVDACERIAAGTIGRIVSVRVEQGFTYETIARAAAIPWSYTYDWGLFENLMPHPLYLACHFLEDPGTPQVVGFNLGRVREAGVEEIRVLIPSRDRVGEVALSLCSSPAFNRLEVVGTLGRILVDFVALTTLTTHRNGLPSIVARFTSNFGTAAKLSGSSLGLALGMVTGRVKRYMGLRALVTEFYQSLRTGTASPIPPEDGIVNLRLMDQVKEACGAALKERASQANGAGKDSHPQPRVLVTGASGFLGGHLVKRLSSGQVPVRATTRLMSRCSPLPRVQWMTCDLGDANGLRRALSGIETVIHCAAMAGAPGSLSDYQDANVSGTVRLLKLAAEAGVKNFIYLSSLSVYEMPRGSNCYLDESTPYDRRAADRGVYTQTKLAAEKALLDHLSEPGAPRVIVLRAGSIYGPGAPLPFGRLTLPLPGRRPVIAGDRRVPMPLTYVDNLIDAVLAAVESKVPTGRIYNVVDSAEADQGTVADTLREVSHGRIRPMFLPYALVWFLLMGLDLLSLARSFKPGTARFRLRRTLAKMKFKCNAAREELGWEPNVSLSEGLARAVESSADTPEQIRIGRTGKAAKGSTLAGLAVATAFQSLSASLEGSGFQLWELVGLW